MTAPQTLARICLIVNYNQYESKRHFSAKFASALQREGVSVFIIDAEETPLDGSAIENILRFNPDFTCSFNTLLPFSNGEYLWDRLRLPHWSILIDPAIYNIGLAKSPFAMVSSVDRGDCQILAKAISERVFFFPHAIERELTSAPNKDLEVVFFGSCYDYEGLRKNWQKQQSAEISALIDTAIEIVLSETRTSIVEALVKACQTLSINPLELDFQTLFYCVDYYTRGKDRVELLRAMQGVRIHLFGEASKEIEGNSQGWGHYLKDSSHITLHPAVSFSEMLNLVSRSKILLNSMPFFKDGTHERVFTALKAGALPVTAQNIYWEEEFKNGEELLLYPPSRWEVAAELVRQHLNDDQRRGDLVEAGRAKVLREHTWDSRAAWVCEHLPHLLQKMIS